MPDSAPKRRWDAQNVKVYTFKLYRKKDQDVIDYLESRNKHDAICAALREYMEKEKK